MRPFIFLALSLLAPANLFASQFDAAGFKAAKGSLDFQELSDGELCVVPNNLPGLGEAEAKKDQTKLCTIDFYTDPGIGICPKGNSTNPGVDVYQLPDGLAKASFESASCKLGENKRPGKKLAKFKQTITCSDTSSILSYFEISQVLGGIGEVPAPVIRTMDIARHRQIVQKGLSTAIAPFWQGYRTKEASPASHPELYTADGRFLYGAMSRNPGGEQRYLELRGKWIDYDHRMDSFLGTPLYRAVANPAPLNLPRTLEGSARTLIALKDTSDMILIDTLLNQQDRFGNEAKYTKYVWTENGELKFKKYKAPDPTASPADKAKQQAEADDMKKKGAVLVDTLLLKDNDCGVSKQNMFASRNVLATVRHMSAKTYHRFLNFADLVAKDPAGYGEYFQKQMLMAPGSWKSVSNNIASARKLLGANCAAGKLMLDLDLELQLGLKADFSNQCD